VKTSQRNLEIELMPHEGTDIWIVALSGPIGVNTYEKLDETLAGMFDEGQFRIIIDMQQVDYVSSAGAGVLLNAMTNCADHGGRFILTNVSTSVWEVFELLQLESVLPVIPSLPAAISSFNAAAVQA
jgi:anti-sigma B factor antagonist